MYFSASLPNNLTASFGSIEVPETVENSITRLCGLVRWKSRTKACDAKMYRRDISSTLIISVIVVVVQRNKRKSLDCDKLQTTVNLFAQTQDVVCQTVVVDEFFVPMWQTRHTCVPMSHSSLTVDGQTFRDMLRHLQIQQRRWCSTLLDLTTGHFRSSSYYAGGLVYTGSSV